MKLGDPPADEVHRRNQPLLFSTAVFIKSQGRSVLRYRSSYLPLRGCRIDWQMVGWIHNIQLIKERTCWNPSNCHSTLWEEQNVPRWKRGWWGTWTYSERTHEQRLMELIVPWCWWDRDVYVYLLTVWEMVSQIIGDQSGVRTSVIILMIKAKAEPFLGSGKLWWPFFTVLWRFKGVLKCLNRHLAAKDLSGSAQWTALWLMDGFSFVVIYSQRTVCQVWIPGWGSLCCTRTHPQQLPEGDVLSKCHRFPQWIVFWFSVPSAGCSLCRRFGLMSVFLSTLLPSKRTIWTSVFSSFNIFTVSCRLWRCKWTHRYVTLMYEYSGRPRSTRPPARLDGNWSFLGENFRIRWHKIDSLSGSCEVIKER